MRFCGALGRCIRFTLLWGKSIGQTYWKERGIGMVSYVVYKDKLKNDYLDVFDKIETYAMTIGIPEQPREEMLAEILDTLYEAQERGTPVEQIVGLDVKQFCKKCFQDYTYAGNFFQDLPHIFFRIAILVFIGSVLELGFMEEETTMLHATMDLGGFVCGLICGLVSSVIISAVAKTLLFRWKRFTNNVFIWMNIVVVAVGITMGVVLCQDVIFTVPLFPTLLVSGGYILLYKLVQYFLRYQRYGSIRKPKEDSYPLKETMKAAWDSEMIENQTTVLEVLVKNYYKKNTRLSKRGKEIVTPEAFTEQIRKENQLRKYDFILMYIVIVVGAGLCIDFESLLDAIVFFAIMLVVEGVILWFFYKAAKAGYEEKAALLAQCDAKDLTLPELWEKRK